MNWLKTLIRKYRRRRDFKNLSPAHQAIIETLGLSPEKLEEKERKNNEQISTGYAGE